jgi:hypothetical protein
MARARDSSLIVAPAEEPPMTPPRSSTLWNSLKVSVFMYESTMFHCRPPSNHTAFASRSGWTKASVSATFGSWVWSIFTFFTPRLSHAASTCSSL